MFDGIIGSVSRQRHEGREPDLKEAWKSGKEVFIIEIVYWIDSLVTSSQLLLIFFEIYMNI